MTESEQPQVFICHASEDKPTARELYYRLIADGIDAWLDEKRLLPGQDWRLEISKAVKDSKAIIVCLSSQSVKKDGFVQREIRLALDAAEEKPEGTIYVIPARINECIVPDSLHKYQWVDLFEEEGYEKIKRALKTRFDLLKKENLSSFNQNQIASSRSAQLAIENLSDRKKSLETLFIESKCMFSTDEYARSYLPGENLYQEKGMLRFTSISLVFSSEDFSLDIPLKNIVSIEMKKFPRITKPITMYYIAIKHLSNFGEYMIGFWADRGTTIWSSNKGTKEWMKIIERIPELSSKIIRP